MVHLAKLEKWPAIQIRPLPWKTSSTRARAPDSAIATKIKLATAKGKKRSQKCKNGMSTPYKRRITGPPNLSAERGVLGREGDC